MKKILLTMLCALLPLLGWAQENEPYAVLSENNTVLTFYYDGHKAERNGLSVGPFTGYDNFPWYAQREAITTVVFDASFAGCTTLTSTAYWFYGCNNLATISGIENLKTDNVTDMRDMFHGCFALTTIDLSKFKTENVTNMRNIFWGCGGLTSIDLSNFNTEEVKNMGYMFYGCSGLTSLDVSCFKTEKVTDMRNMFSGCSGLTSLDVSCFKTEKVTDMRNMFQNCTGLMRLDLSSFNTANVTNMAYMFDGCSRLKAIFVSEGWSTATVTSGNGMFRGCSNLAGGKGTVYSSSHTDYTYAHIDQGPDSEAPGYFTRSGDTPWVKLEAYAVLSDSNTVLTFYYDDQKVERNGLSVGPFGDPRPFNPKYSPYQSWKAQCDSITTVVFDASFAACTTITSTRYWFYKCSNLTTISGMENLNTSNVTDMGYMFYDCSALKTIYVGEGWSTAAVTDGANMFRGCSNLVGGKGTEYNTDHTDYTYARIDQGTGSEAPGYFTRSGDAPWVERAYAVLSDSNTVLTFYYDGQKTERNGMSLGSQPWSAQRDSITTVVFDESFAACTTLTSTASWFHGCSNLATISGIENLKTDNVTDMSYMFYDCTGLTSLDLSNFNTEKVTDMRYMFRNCSRLKTIFVGEGWSTAAVTSGYDMFKNCSNLAGGKGTEYSSSHTDYTYARIDQGPDSDAPGYFTRSGDAPWVKLEAYAVLSDSNTVLTFYYDSLKVERNGLSVGPFSAEASNGELISANQSWNAQCNSITTVVFDTSFADCTTLTSTAYWFAGCSNLATVSGIENLNTANVTDMTWMFYGCSALTSLDLSKLNTSNVKWMIGMFKHCSALASLDLSNLNTSNVTNMNSMFYECSALASLDLSSFNTKDVTNMGWMFHKCSSLTSLDLSKFNTGSVTDIYYMFYGCSALTNLDLSKFNTGNVTNMNGMFRDCSALASIDLSSFNTSNVTTIWDMFYGCSALTSIDLSSFKTSSVADMYAMFANCSALTSIDLSSFNTSNVTDVRYMFSGCNGLTTIYVGEEWNTNAVTDGNYIFANCLSLVGGKGTKYDAEHTDYTYARIDQGPDSDAPGYFTRSGDAPWVEPTEPESTFDGRVLTVRGSGSIDAALAQVGGLEQVDKTITAIVWEADVPYSGEAAFSNPNLLFYANDATKGQAINNLIYNGVAESITLTDEGEGNTDFYCPQSFTARSITYKRSFQQQTEIGVSRGWETIALPFTVQRIDRVRSDEGQERITPFGSSEGSRHFWLRRLTANGLQSVQTIEANTPYIIAMPNSEEYAAEYNLAGDIVFTAENATVAVTEPVSDRSADYELTANFERMAAQDSIYVLNVGAPRYGYPEGSIFEAAYRDLQPFRAYTRHINSGRPAPPYFALGDLGGDNTTGISSVSDATFATDTWYDIQGRKLQGRPTKKGVYIHNGRKVIVR